MSGRRTELSLVLIKDVVFKSFWSFSTSAFQQDLLPTNAATGAPSSLTLEGSKQEPNFKARIPRNQTLVFQLFTKLWIFQSKIKSCWMVEQEHDFTTSRVGLRRQRPFMYVNENISSVWSEIAAKIFLSNHMSLKEQTLVMVSRMPKTFLLGRMVNLLMSLYTVFFGE